MKRYGPWINLFLALLLFGTGTGNAQSDYIGQEKPGLHAKIFAPGIISTDAMEFAGTFSPDFTEYYFTRRTSLQSGTNTIWVTKKIEDQWTDPEIAPFSGDVFDFEPHITPDGSRLYFGSARYFEGRDPRLSMNQWYMERSDTGWTDPQPLGSPFMERFVMYPWVSDAGNMYFTGMDGLYMSELIAGVYQEPVKLSEETVNIHPLAAHPYIARDESYLTFDAAPGAPADYSTNLYICFQKSDGTWTRARNMGEQVSATGTEMTASVSPDGECFFFYRDEDIYWIDASIIDQLKFKPDLQAAPLTGHAPLTVSFSTDFSETFMPMTSLKWDFDSDGTYDSQETGPFWTYEQSGAYTVSLQVHSDTLSCDIPFLDFIQVFDGESALRFDGRTSHVSCPATPSLNLTGAFTIEAWIRPTGWGEFANFGLGRIIDKKYISLQLLDSYVTFNPHSLFLQLFHSAGSVSYSNTPANSISLDQWQHIAVTYDGLSRLTLYINGVEQALDHTTPPSGSIRDHSQFNLFIGSDTNTGNHFQGDMDEVRLWNVTKSQEEISAGMDSYLSGGEPGLVAYWRMNEGNGVELIDHSGHEHKATIIDGSWIQGLHFNTPSGDTDGDGILDDADNCPFRYNPEQEAVENGDIDCSGGINVLDVLAVVNHILGTSTLIGGPLERADCNNDGSVNIVDALGIVNVILGIGQCAPHARPIVTPEVIEYCRTLKPLLSNEDYTRFMALVRAQMALPVEYRLEQNYPNPFNPTTVIAYTIPVERRKTKDEGRGGTFDSRLSSLVSLKVYNILGQEVAMLVDEVQEPGYYTVTWEASGMPSGVYFYRLTAGDFVSTRRMLLCK